MGPHPTLAYCCGVNGGSGERSPQVTALARAIWKARLTTTPRTTQLALSQQVGVSRSLVSDWERGLGRLPDRAELDMVAACCSLSGADRRALHDALAEQEDALWSQREGSESAHDADPNAPESAPEPQAPAAPSASIDRLPIASTTLVGRQLELDWLDACWERAEANVAVLVAWGGVGKSAVVAHWVHELRKQRYRGADRVFCWSFFSQGASDGLATSDEFLESALWWFGDEDPASGTAWRKGIRLLRLLRAERSLLVLDGLEPLQHPPGAWAGQLRDRGLRALLAGLAQENPGLCVVTTRIGLVDLEEGYGDAVAQRALERVSPSTGRLILRNLGVEGPDSELERASADFHGHCLALTLLGRLVTEACGGAIERRWEWVDRHLEHDAHLGGQAQRVMSSYERWLGSGPHIDLLRLVGLFERPADGPAVRALLDHDPPIDDLTHSLSTLNRAQLALVVTRLRAAGLLAPERGADDLSLDAHPLVREHFGHDLERNHPNTWLSAHQCLYDHYIAVAPEHPENAEDMRPLFAAVAHGTLAGMHQRVFDEVFLRRIASGPRYVSTRGLGPIGSDLGPLSRFFDELWTRPNNSLSDLAKGQLLHQVGYRLWGLGRLAEAAHALSLSRDLADGLGDHGAVVSRSRDLSYVLVGSGRLLHGFNVADEALAQPSKTAGLDEELLPCLVARAHAHHQLGRWHEARSDFDAADALRSRVRPDLPHLALSDGYHYCDLLLDLGDVDGAMRGARWLRDHCEHPERDYLLYSGLSRLILARAALVPAAVGWLRPEDSFAVEENVETAVERFLAAGHEYGLPRGLLMRARYWASVGDISRAVVDADRVLATSSSAGMRLHEVDALLLLAELAILGRRMSTATAMVDAAREAVEDIGYGRRAPDVERLAAALRTIG